MLRLLGADQIIALHDDILLTTGIGLPGLAPDKDIHGMLARVENRIRYGLVRRNDLLYVGAFYATAIATGHCFNDGNKRTAFVAMDVFLRMNGIAIRMREDRIVMMMVSAGKGQIGDERLALHITDSLYQLYFLRND